LAESKALDRRVVRTRQALTAAFSEALLASGYDRLNVEAIAARANIGRSTFYLHFSGKAEILTKSLATHFAVLADAVVVEGDMETLRKVIEHFGGNRELAKQIFCSAARQVLSRSLAALMAERLRPIWPKKRTDASYLPLGLAAWQIAEAQLATIEQWLGGNFRCSPAIISLALRRSSQAMSLALLSCAKNPE